MLLRPHHIYCIHFSDFSDPSRGREYEEARSKIQSLFQTEEDNIEVKEGPDFLCSACPHFNGQGCSHPKGDETEIRKWDRRIIEGLDLKFGQVLKIKEVKSLIKEKAPLTFCLTRCRYYRENRCNPRMLPQHRK